MGNGYVAFRSMSLWTEEVSPPRGLPASPFAPQALPCFIATMSCSDCHGSICCSLPFNGLSQHTISGEPWLSQVPFASFTPVAVSEPGGFPEPHHSGSFVAAFHRLESFGSPRRGHFGPVSVHPLGLRSGASLSTLHLAVTCFSARLGTTLLVMRWVGRTFTCLTQKTSWRTKT